MTNLGQQGERIRLIKMVDDPAPVEPGAKGSIMVVDGLGTRHITFDNGRRIGLVPGVDQWVVLDPHSLEFQEGEKSDRL